MDSFPKVLTALLVLASTTAWSQLNGASTNAPFVQQEIDHLFFYIGGARRCSLMTNSGVQDNHRTMVALQQRYNAVKDKVTSAEDFIAHVATADNKTGRALYVQCRRDGKRVQIAMDLWLQTELELYRDAGRP